MSRELSKYISEKVKVLSQMGFKVSRSTFAHAVNEIQVDHIARAIIFS